ncbi:MULTISPECIES: nucleotidyltransferase family protein [unclassified Nocardioides]|uniref:nucleotidyltransferase family protein n=1 Tax=unclassified Nocardioides TaxID=2615069 RepID=UPI0012E394F6|nr:MULTISPECIES: nucleotidyltransferase family protein [unclassified Nocardioides]
MTASPAALGVLRTLVKGALGAEEGRPAEPVSLGEVAPHDLLEVIGRHRVSDVLRTHADALGLPREITSVMDAWRQRNQQRLMLQTLETVRAVRLLDEHGIDVLVFKGQALAVQTTGQYDARGPGDIDLLVAPGKVADAHRVLKAAGWALHAYGQIEPEMWAWGHVNRWGSALTYIGAGGDVDLHWRFEPLRGAHPEFAELWPRRELVEIGGAQVATLSPRDALGHLAGHREGWTWMRTLIDLRRLARDPAVFDGGLRAPAAVSLAVARETVGLPVGVPPRIHAQLDRVPAAVLDRARANHSVSNPSTYSGGSGGHFRHHVASSRNPGDLGRAVVVLALPAHAALPIRSRTAWTGVPSALRLRFGNLVRALLGRVRRDAPCVEQPAPVA